MIEELHNMDELHYLRWFRQNAKYVPEGANPGPYLNSQYERETGYKVPEQWRTDVGQ